LKNRKDQCDKRCPGKAPITNDGEVDDLGAGAGTAFPMILQNDFKRQWKVVQRRQSRRSTFPRATVPTTDALTRSTLGTVLSISAQLRLGELPRPFLPLPKLGNGKEFKSGSYVNTISNDAVLHTYAEPAG
jgi:hypothetical protein